MHLLCSEHNRCATLAGKKRGEALTSIVPRMSPTSSGTSKSPMKEPTDGPSDYLTCYPSKFPQNWLLILDVSNTSLASLQLSRQDRKGRQSIGIYYILSLVKNFAMFEHFAAHPETSDGGERF
jgi:hypothetical protein